MRHLKSIIAVMALSAACGGFEESEATPLSPAVETPVEGPSGLGNRSSGSGLGHGPDGCGETEVSLTGGGGVVILVPQECDPEYGPESTGRPPTTQLPEYAGDQNARP
jgi:hypothetical protein